MEACDGLSWTWVWIFLPLFNTTVTTIQKALTLSFTNNSDPQILRRMYIGYVLYSCRQTRACGFGYTGVCSQCPILKDVCLSVCLYLLTVCSLGNLGHPCNSPSTLGCLTFEILTSWPWGRSRLLGWRFLKISGVHSVIWEFVVGHPWIPFLSRSRLQSRPVDEFPGVLCLWPS